MQDVAGSALNSIVSSGVIGSLLVVAIIALWVIMGRRDEENKTHRAELMAALQKKDEKLQSVMEQTCVNSTQAMNDVADATRDNAAATRENTRVLQNVPCVKSH